MKLNELSCAQCARVAAALRLWDKLDGLMDTHRLYPVDGSASAFLSKEDTVIMLSMFDRESENEDREQ